MRYAYASSSPAGVYLLEFLRVNSKNINGEFFGVITAPDKPTGRGQAVLENSISRAARDLNLRVFKPRNQEEIAEIITKNQIDLVVTMAFGVLIGKQLLQLSKYGWVNLHLSLLPKYRGAAPVQYALLNQETETGISLFKLDEGLDTGPLAFQEKTQIGDKENSAELMKRLSELASGSLLKLINNIENQDFSPQIGEPSFAPKLKKSQGKIEFGQDSRKIHAQYRAFTPWPGSYADFRGKKIIFTSLDISQVDLKGLLPGEAVIKGGELLIQTGSGTLVITKIKPENSKELRVMDFGNGIRYQKTEVLKFE